MKTKSIFSGLIIAAIPFVSEADIFKCVVDGKTTYQATPCKEEKHETSLDIKTVDQERNERGAQAKQNFELLQQQKRLMEAETELKRAIAQKAYSEAEAEAIRAETEAREADAYNQRSDALSKESEARARYWNKKAGISPYSIRGR